MVLVHGKAKTIIYSYLACGDNILDSIYYAYLPATYTEQCDDGNVVNGDGCNSLCVKETLPRTWSWTTYSYTIVKEVQTPTTGNPTYSDCRAPYMPTESGPQYNPKPGNYLCYIGKYCLDCTNPKFPGYPSLQLSFLDTSPYGFVAHHSRGRVRALSVGTSAVAVTYVGNDQTYVISNGPVVTIPHNNAGSVRQSVGHYYIENSGTNSFVLYQLAQDASLVWKLIQIPFTLTKVLPPQQGNEFFIWWPGPNLILSRNYNGRTWDFFGLHSNIIDAIANPSKYPQSQHIDGPYLSEFVLAGSILFDAVFRGTNMYIPYYIADFAAAPNTAYQVGIYQANLPWGINTVSTVTVPNQILSIASFTGGVIVTTTNAANPFYNIDTQSTCTVTYTGATPTCLLNWQFMQSRPSPDSTNINQPVYAFCNAAAVYPVSFTTATNTLTIDSVNIITLPNDQPESRNKQGRYNLNYPWDITGQYLVNFAIHPCSTYILYKWDEINDMSISIYDLVGKTTKCIDVTNSETLFQ